LGFTDLYTPCQCIASNAWCTWTRLDRTPIPRNGSFYNLNVAPTPSLHRDRRLTYEAPASHYFKTAGAYHNSIDAENELKHLPSRGNKRTAVVTSDDERADQEGTPPSAKEEEDGAAASDASSDTSYDSDDQPKPKKKKCKQPSKPRARRKKRVQKPAHVEYRSSIRNQQSIDNVPTFYAEHLGSELCMVIAQLFREFTRVGTFSGLTSVFLHPHADWLEALEVQATASRNTWMAHAAHVLRVAQARS